MIDLNELSEQVYANKLEKHFNVTDVGMEICFLHGEVSELWDAYIRKRGSVGEEMADILIYLLGLSQILNVNLEQELLKKIEKNHRRVYKMIDGVNTRVSEGEEAQP